MLLVGGPTLGTTTFQQVYKKGTCVFFVGQLEKLRLREVK